MSTRPEVTTTAGAVRGVWRERSAAFLGIPYGEPPVGHLRFAAPVAHRPWEHIRDAGEYGPTPQREALAEVTLIPEPSIAGDATLNVNVFTPALPRPGQSALNMPVLVYIHGGGYVAGSSASPWYDGMAFNRDGVVTVSISYRLGFDGFGWIEDAPHNRAILDWLLALEWVQSNIGAFGGDPAQVTIAGQSAGGGAVLTLLAVPSAAALFHRAISISGATSDLPLAEAEQLGRMLAQHGGVAPTRVGLAALSEARILELQNQIASPVSDADDDRLAPLVELTAGGLKWGPVVDGRLLPESASEALAHGTAADKALLIGTTDNEFNMVLAPHAEALSAAPVDAMLGKFGLSTAAAEAYASAHSSRGAADVVGQYVTDMMFRAPALAVAAGRAECDAPTWLYRFAWPSPTMGGACHCLDMPFFFDCLVADRVAHLAGPHPPQELADEVHGAAVRFIVDGDPGWGRFEKSQQLTRIYDHPSRTESHGYADVEMLMVASKP